MQSNLRKAV